MNRNRLHTDNTPRHCSRCGDALTDPASRECGVGPICRKKDTHLYAKTITANFAVATIRALSIRPDMLAAECVDGWNTAVQKLLKAAEKVANITDDDLIIQRTGADLRDIMRACDLVCSYEHPNSQVRNTVIDIVQACGYVGLAGVLAGKSSTSPSKVWFDNGRVYMTGLGNKSGWSAMRQIPGILTPRYRGDRSPYSAPAAQATSFLNNVRRFWPMYEGDISAIATEAAGWVNANSAVAQTYANTSAPVYSFVATTRTQDFTVAFSWVRGVNMFEFTNQLKTIPANERSYDPNTRTWSFTLNNLDQVMNMARNSNIFTEVRKVETENSTPVGMYGERNIARRTYRQQNTWHSTNRSGWRAR